MELYSCSSYPLAHTGIGGLVNAPSKCSTGKEDMQAQVNQHVPAFLANTHGPVGTQNNKMNYSSSIQPFR